MIPHTRVKVGHGVQHRNDDDILIEHRQDVESLLALNHYQRTHESSGRPGGNRPVARLDNTTWFKLYKQGIAPEQNYPAFRRWLERNPAYKTTEKKLWIPR